MAKRSSLVLACSIVLSALVFSATATSAETGGGTSFKTARVKAAGISFRYPSTWTVYPTTKKALAAQQKQLAKKNPKVALSADQQAQLLQTSRFRAADLGAEFAGRFSSNLQVQVVDEGGFPSTLDDFRSAIKSGYEQRGATVLNTSSVQIAGATSFRVDVRLPVNLPDGRTVVARVGQLFVPHGGGAVIITITAPDDHAGAKLGDDVLGSVRRI